MRFLILSNIFHLTRPGWIPLRCPEKESQYNKSITVARLNCIKAHKPIKLNQKDEKFDLEHRMVHHVMDYM